MPLPNPHGSNTEARQHFGLCWFSEASRNRHPEVETGASFKCLGGPCSHCLIPGAFQSPPWVACSVLPRVEVTIPHCKDQSNKKICIHICTRFYIPFNILTPATFDLENLSKRRLQNAAFHTENMGQEAFAEQ